MKCFFLILGLFSFFMVQAQPGRREPLALADSAFYMPVEDVFPVQGRGLAVVGKVSTGKVKPGQLVHLKGFSATPIVARVSVIDKYGGQIAEAMPGDVIGLLFAAGVSADQVKRGMVATDTGFAKLEKSAQAEITILAGTNLTWRNGDEIMAYVNGVDVPGCKLVLPEGQTIKPGRKAKVTIEFPQHLVIIPNLLFAVRNNSFRTTATGKFLVLPN
jgi:translation elongation factor EF-Tu-like GTPase